MLAFISAALRSKVGLRSLPYHTNQWALNHLLRLVLDREVTLGSGSTNGKVASLFENTGFVNGEYEYPRGSQFKNACILSRR